MKKVIRISAVSVFAIVLLMAQACSYSIVHISNVKVFSADGVTETTSFKTGDTLKATAQVSDNPGEIYAGFLLYAEDVPGMTKGDFVPHTGIGRMISGDRMIDYLSIIPPDMKSGTYTLRAELKNDKGENRKGGASVTITITQTASSDDKKGK